MPIGVIIDSLSIVLGGILLLATGFRMIKVKMFPTADMIPSMIIIMPISALWTNYIVPFLNSLI